MIQSPARTAAAAIAPLILLATEASAQVCWSEVLISDSVDRASSIQAADIDGDGDLDTVSAAFLGDTITWHENLAGDGSTWSAHTIFAAADGASCVFCADVDGDGDVDVLSTSSVDGVIAWHENVAGDGSTWTQRPFSQGAAASSVAAADFDGDGDLDAVTSARAAQDTLVWHENLSGDGSSWASYAVTDPCPDVFCHQSYAVVARDMDADGDVDIVSAARLGFFTGSELVWFENPGTGGAAWTEHDVQILGDATFTPPVVTDVDGDGDIDCVSAFSDLGGAGTFWWDNTPGAGNGWTARPVSSRVAGSVEAFDVDGDGDTDVVIAEAFQDEIYWYENQSGAGMVWVEHVISIGNNRVEDLAAADIDGDGDLDALTASRTLDEVTWIRNSRVGVVGVQYCAPAVANSSGEAATICATGSDLAADMNLTLTANALPSGSFGFFNTSQAQGSVPMAGGSEGTLCLGGSIGRYVGAGQIQNSGTQGSFSLSIPFSMTPTPTGFVTIAAGETWNFQAWFRDAVGGMATSNFTDGVEVLFR